jgi:hypothetical protein
VVEGLSRDIKEKVRGEKIEGIPIARGIYITHMMFVDDVILFGNGNIVEAEVLKGILELLCKATGMALSPHKYSFLEVGWDG